MKRLILISIFLVVILLIHAQNVKFEWSKQLGGSSYENSYSMDFDAEGNVYLTGCFQGTVDFDPGIGVFNLTSSGEDDIFISKLDVSGSFIWAIKIGGAQSDVGYSIICDSLNNLYICGFFDGTIDFDPGTGIYNMTSSVGISNGFLLKIDHLGNFIWAKQFSNITFSNGTIAVDILCNIFITGNFYNTADFDPGAGTYNMTSAGESDIFVLKLNSLGNFIWAKQMGSENIDNGRTITIDKFANVYTTGSFSGTVDFDPGVGNYYLTGTSSIFISKLDSSGNFVWAKQMTGTGMGCSIIVDYLSNVYTTGSFQNTADFDPGVGTYNMTCAGGSDVFLLKLNSLGNFIWAKRLGGIDSPEIGCSIDIDSVGNVYTTGIFKGTVDFDPGAGTYNLTSFGLTDIFINKLDSSGNFIWTKQIGGSNYDNSSAIAVDSSNSIFITGSFSGVVDFDPVTSHFNLTALGNEDIFVCKFSQIINTFSNLSIIACDSYTSPSGKYTWNESGTFTDTIPNASGCDSIVTLKLTIMKSTLSYISDTACGSYELNDSIYNASGIYVQSLTNKYGCDSTVTLNLVFNCQLNKNQLNTLLFYPNPTTEYIIIDNSDNNTMSIQVTDMSGRILIEKNISGKQLNVQSLLPGIYILKIDGSVFKLVKQ